MTNPYRNINELREWLKANSSGDYRPAAHAEAVIEEQESELITLRAENDRLRAKLAAMESLDNVLVDAVDDLGNWLCRDMEKEAAKSCRFTDGITTYAVIADVAKRIRFYRENCLKYSLGNRAMRAGNPPH